MDRLVKLVTTDQLELGTCSGEGEVKVPGSDLDLLEGWMKQPWKSAARESTDLLFEGILHMRRRNRTITSTRRRYQAGRLFMAAAMSML